MACYHLVSNFWVCFLAPVLLVLWGTQKTVATGYKHSDFVTALQVYQLGGLGHALPCLGVLSVMVTAKPLPERRVLCVWSQQGACGSIILWSLSPTLLRATEQVVEAARKALGRLPVPGGGEVQKYRSSLVIWKQGISMPHPRHPSREQSHLRTFHIASLSGISVCLFLMSMLSQA